VSDALEAIGLRQWRVRGDFDLERAADVLNDSIANFDFTKSLEVDLGAVERVDSAGLALLVDWSRRADAGGGSLIVRAVPQSLQKLAEICGLGEWLAEHQTMPESQ
jgi:phospholipid transport system transporter-binding protein